MGNHRADIKAREWSWRASTRASVYKKDRDKGRKGASYYVAYTDETGKRHNIKACPDKAANEAMARKLESDVELRGRGVIDPRADALAAQQARSLAAHLVSHLCRPLP